MEECFCSVELGSPWEGLTLHAHSQLAVSAVENQKAGEEIKSLEGLG